MDNAPKISLYTQPGCGPCHKTKDALKRAELDFTEYDITTDPDALKRILDLGYKQTPVIVSEDDHWSGYNRVKLNNLIK